MRFSWLWLELMLLNISLLKSLKYPLLMLRVIVLRITGSNSTGGVSHAVQPNYADPRSHQHI